MSAKWTTAQHYELEWWTNNDFDPSTEWKYYDAKFGPVLADSHFEFAADVGSGPVSYLYNPNVKFTFGFAVDTLIDEYYKIRKFNDLRTKPMNLKASLEPASQKMDAIFCLNTLDHADDPVELLSEIIDGLKDDGLLFFFVDIDKPPDLMHPHKITIRWLVEYLFPHFYPLVNVVEQSWKFQNNVFYYVGRKIERGIGD